MANNENGFTKKSKSKIAYPDPKSVLKNVLHNEDFPVPVPL